MVIPLLYLSIESTRGKNQQPPEKNPCSRSQPSATVARALLSPSQRTLRSLWQVFKAQQGEKTQGLEGNFEACWHKKRLLKCTLTTPSRITSLVRHTCQPLHLRPEKRVAGTATQDPIMPRL